MLIHPSTKAFIARSVRRVFPLPEQHTDDDEMERLQEEEKALCVHTLGTAKDEQQRLLAKLLCQHKPQKGQQGPARRTFSAGQSEASIPKQ